MEAVNPGSLAAGEPRALGWHALADYYEVDSAPLQAPAQLRAWLLTQIPVFGGTIITDTFHEFSPFGASGVIIIAESHVTLHTWPEHRFVALDAFACSPRFRIRDFCQAFGEFLRAGRSHYREVQRGDQIESKSS